MQGLRAYARQLGPSMGLKSSALAPKSPFGYLLRAGYSTSSPEGNTKDSRDEHIAHLRKYYPDNLIQSILATESVVSPQIYKQVQSRPGTFAPAYADDYAEYDPLFDHAQGEWVDKSRPRQPIPQRAPRHLREKDDVMSSRSHLAVNLSNLEKSTGLKKEFLAQLKVKPLLTKRVVNMETTGKKRRMYALAVVGDGNGHIGIGQGKSQDYSGAIKMAHWEAAKNIKYIPRFKERTIYGNIDIKKGAVHIQLRAARPGSGLRVNHVIYEICKIAGIKDLVGNVYGSRNPMNVAKTTIEALTERQVVIDEIAVNRGKRVVDVTNTYLNF